MSYGTFTGNAPLGTCAFWPVPATSKPHQISVAGFAADPGGVDDERPRHAVSGGRRPGQAARRVAADVRGHPAHGGVPGQSVRRRHRRQVPRRRRGAAAGCAAADADTRQVTVGLLPSHRSHRNRSLKPVACEHVRHVAGGQADRGTARHSGAGRVCCARPRRRRRRARPCSRTARRRCGAAARLCSAAAQRDPDRPVRHGVACPSTTRIPMGRKRNWR